VICVASSGIVALLLEGDCTAHSHFKIPLELSDTSSCAIRKNSLKGELIKVVNAFIWDKAIMQHYYAFDVVNCFLKDIKDNDCTFEDANVVFGSDLQQILPVIFKRSRVEDFSDC
jgi:hypothetical protein